MPHRSASSLRIAFHSAATVTALAGVAAAQPASAPAAAEPPPPATHSWDEVSHVNGQLVPIGESNEYLKDFRRTNISTNPVGMMAGFFGVSVSHAVTDQLAIRGDVNYVDLVDSDWQMFEAGVGASLYLRRAYQGPFIEPGVIVRTSKNADCQECEASDTIGPQVLFGWHRSWDSGFNVAAAAGLGRDLADGDDESVFFNGYFRVGYSF